MRKTIYIAGPMAGLTGLNYPAFYNAETKLMKAGWRVVNPARFDAVFNVYILTLSICSRAGSRRRARGAN